MSEDPCCMVLVRKENAKLTRKRLEAHQLYDGKFKMKVMDAELVALPIFISKVGCLDSILWDIEHQIRNGKLARSRVALAHSHTPENLRKEVTKLAKDHNFCDFPSILSDLPKHWVKYGSDMVVFPSQSFTSTVWDEKGIRKELWRCIAGFFGVSCIGKEGRISSDNFRSPKIELVYGNNSWVTVVNNGIKYTFDTQRSMFCSGNISEKIRIGRLNCQGETVVDLYAGVGYFVLPFLLHAHALLVYACEWNPASLEALKQNLKLNNVTERCIVLEGDNKEVAPEGVADRVNLGLIPSSVQGWPVACRALNKKKGGWMHVHGNVETPVSMHTHETEVADTHLVECRGKMTDSAARRKETWACWSQAVASKIKLLLTEEKMHWTVRVHHVEHVKSYAPHVDHVVVDLECRPVGLP